MMRIGVDLGGTKTEIVALDDAGQVRLRRRVPTPAHDYDAIVRTVADLVHAAETQLGVRASVGVGTPGSPSPATGRMRNCNTTALNGRPLPRDLSRALGREVAVGNDADCFALSEATDGAAAGKAVVFGVILGTGVGGGLVVHGRLLAGPNAIAGEWGHNPLPWPTEAERPGPACYCGKHGCIETFVSGPGLARDHGGGTTADAIVQAALVGDATADVALARWEDRLARSLATVIDIVDPDAIVIGGGLSNIDRLYDRVPALLPRWVFSDTVCTPILRNAHGDSSGVRGAAWLGAPADL